MPGKGNFLHELHHQGSWGSPVRPIKSWHLYTMFFTFAVMEMFDRTLNTYLEQTCDTESELLRRINRETHLRETAAHMISGHYQGRVLALLSKLVAPRCILEIGTFTGYASLCLAEGLAANGVIHTIDNNSELRDRVSDYFATSAYADRIVYHIGQAESVIPTIETPFDLVFIDADKKNNERYFELVLTQSSPGALILIDNMLWKGKVIAGATDNQTREIVRLNEKLSKDERVDKVMLPIRDGLFVLRKR